VRTTNLPPGHPDRRAGHGEDEELGSRAPRQDFPAPGVARAGGHLFLDGQRRVRADAPAPAALPGDRRGRRRRRALVNARRRRRRGARRVNRETRGRVVRLDDCERLLASLRSSTQLVYHSRLGHVLLIDFRCC
jgi:hypothetical protein